MGMNIENQTGTVLDGKLTIARMETLKGEVLQSLGQKTPIVLNFSEAEGMDYAFAQGLLAIAGTAAAQGVACRFEELGPEHKQALNALGFWDKISESAECHRRSQSEESAGKG